ncbi:MAG: PhoH family protein [Legionellaceae bacterium]|nr:PhoH family protein [Legionellaceae bacterium]
MLTTTRLNLTPENNQRLFNLCGQYNENLNLITKRLDVNIKNRGHQFILQGNPVAVKAAEQVLMELYQESEKRNLDKRMIHLTLQNKQNGYQNNDRLLSKVKARSETQAEYIKNILKNDLNFGIGPAGTGKTFLAVACAVEALEKDHVERIVLVRPAVEAGEKLGFLPGDLSQKVDPYLRPLYDSLFELLGVKQVERLIESNVIEIAPLAYMRGRTLNNAFIIMDESQNTTAEQMKMFLTRIGFGSTTVVNGDMTQIDLPRHQRSGLVDVADVLKDISGVSFTYFSASDVVRHPIVQKIITAYEQHEKITS